MSKKPEEFEAETGLHFSTASNPSRVISRIPGSLSRLRNSPKFRIGPGLRTGLELRTIERKQDTQDRIGDGTSKIRALICQL